MTYSEQISNTIQFQNQSLFGHNLSVSIAKNAIHLHSFREEDRFRTEKMLIDEVQEDFYRFG